MTTRIADAGVAWGQFAGADAYIRRNIHTIRTSNPDQALPLANGVTRFGQAGLSYIRSDPRRMTSVMLAPRGEACYTVLDDTAPWQDRLSLLRQGLLTLPHDMDLAFIRYSNVSSLSWTAIATAGPAVPYVREHKVSINRHLHPLYTSDAHGIQVFTDAHLERCTDLSDWIVEPLGAGRSLVRANDLEAWYSQTHPDPDTLSHARVAFGKALLTPDAIANTPPPWKRQQP